MSHASIPSAQRALPEDLVRLSAGIEDPGDLAVDLVRALDRAVPGLACLSRSGAPAQAK